MRWAVLENLCNSGLLEPRHVDVFDESHDGGFRGLEALQSSRGRQFSSDLWVALLRAGVPGFRIRNATFLAPGISQINRAQELRWRCAAASEMYFFAQRDVRVTTTLPTRVHWTVCEGTLTAGTSWETAPGDALALHCTSDGALVVATHAIPHTVGRPDVAADRPSGFQTPVFAFPENLPQAFEK